MIDFAHLSGLVNFHWNNSFLTCMHAWKAPEPWCISLGFLWSCRADRQKFRLHPGPPCSPYVTPSVNTAADKLCPSLPDLDIVSSRKDVWNSLTLNQGIIICSEQTASLVLTLTFPDKSPSLFAAVTHSAMMRLVLPLRQNASPPNFRSMCTSSQRTFLLSPVRADPFRTNPDVIGRSRDEFSPLIGRHKSFQTCDWSEMSQTGEQLGWCSI